MHAHMPTLDPSACCVWVHARARAPPPPLQAISRVWRYGQARPVFIYHLLYGGTFEARVFDRVLLKEELFQRVSKGTRAVAAH